MGHKTKFRIRTLGFVIALALMGTVAVNAIAEDGSGTVHIPNQIDDPALQIVVLYNLDGTGFLRGTAADVTHPSLADFGRAFSDPASPPLEFHFDATVNGTPSEDRVHFAETMAYYHIATYDAYVDWLGFGAAFTPIPVTVFSGFDAFPPFGLWAPIGTQYDPATGGISLAMNFDVEQSDALIVHE